ncbi:MAG: FecR family protein [Spirochaetota bacterium]
MKANIKLLNSSIVVTTLCVLLTILFSAMLYSSYSTKKDIMLKDNVGVLSFKKESALRKYGGQVVWEDITQDMPVYNGDTLRTEKFSEAVIKLKDGTRITMESDSMIILSFSKESIDIGFNYGSISAKRDAGSEQFGRLKIDAGRMSLNVGQSSLQLKGRSDAAMNVSVHEGSADIVSGNKVVKLTNREQAVITKNSDELHISPVSLSLLEPENSKYITAASDTVNISFKWQKNGKAGSTTFELSDDSSFSDKLVAREINRNSLELNIRPGIYYWRLQADQDKTDKKIYSDIFKFTFIKEPPVKLVHPADGQRFSFYSAAPPISFQWQKSPTASLYRLVVSGDAAFSKAHIAGDTDGETLTDFTLGEGTWYWKVIVKTPFSEDYIDTGAVKRSFSILKMKKLPQPELVFPEENRKFQVEWLRKNRLYFNWEKSQELVSSEFILAGDKDFKNILIRKIIPGSYISLEELLPGSYFWKVISWTQKNDLRLSSAARHFSVLKEMKISLLSPPDKLKLEKPFSLNKLPVQFKWECNNSEALCSFEMSGSRDFGENILKKEIKENVFNLDDIGNGTFYWRVNAMDERRNIVQITPVRELHIIPTLDKPVPIVPQNQSIINMRDRNSLEMSWSRITGAQVYIVRLYYLHGTEFLKVHEARTIQNSLRLTNLSMLNRGRFSWTVTGSRMEKDDGTKAINSPEGKGYFEITLGKKLDEPKIISPDIQYRQ